PDVSEDLSSLQATLGSIEAVLDPDQMRAKLAELENDAADPDLWNDQDRAQQVTRRMASLRADLGRLDALRGRLDDLAAAVELGDADLLMRMYLRWAERHEHPTEVFDTSYAEEAGIKSATFVVKAPFAYGTLAGEHGVHRLVRISPFDNQSRRQTSFAGVDVTPVVEETDHV